MIGQSKNEYLPVLPPALGLMLAPAIEAGTPDTPPEANSCPKPNLEVFLLSSGAEYWREYTFSRSIK